MVFLLSSCSIFTKTPKQEEYTWDIEWEDEKSTRIIRKEEVKIRDIKLATYYESWLGTPHRMGGMTKQGVDCSGFVLNVYKDVYGIKLPRTASQMSQAVRKINRNEMKEGDLIFFARGTSKPHHVGIYLKDNNFVHTSTSRGVTISNLEDKYWANLFSFCGRHPSFP
ncbi:MAG: NlpC/P60 family protein [Bacteroidales bacterium]|nr:NlpC/P60 family protein [Bacteroidales bacterium]